jgi:hypothetical protein
MQDAEPKNRPGLQEIFEFDEQLSNYYEQCINIDNQNYECFSSLVRIFVHTECGYRSLISDLIISLKNCSSISEV